MLSWTLIDRQHSYSIFPGEKRKNTSMNSLNLLWTFVGFQKLDWISLETIFECWLQSKGPRCLVTNKKYLCYLLQLSTTKHGVCQKTYENICRPWRRLSKIWFWILLKIYGDDIIVYFVLDAITPLFLTLKYWTRFKAFVFNFTK